MPAKSCPTCGYDFRAGKAPVPPAPASEPSPASRSHLYLVAAVAIMILIVVGFLLFGGGDEPPEILSSPSGGGSILQPLPANPPPLAPVSPAKTIGNAKSVAEQADEKVRQARDLYEGGE